MSTLYFVTVNYPGEPQIALGPFETREEASLKVKELKAWDKTRDAKIAIR